MTDLIQDFSGDALTALLSPGIRLLGLGEPTHRVEAFLELRNEVFRHLVEHRGYRSIALESDCLSALVAEAYVDGGDGSLDDVVRRAISHEWGDLAGNRELVRWMRAENERRAGDDRLHFYGFDGPLEISGAESPRPALTALCEYLAAHLDLAGRRERIEELLGADERWTDPGAMRDAGRSIGATPAARELRLIADDLRVLLLAHAPHLTAATSADAWWRADLYARTTAGLLRYHAALADPAPGRFGTMLSLRDAMMADNLHGILRREERRGPTMVFAHNSHLQREQSRMDFAGRSQRWWSAGAIVGTALGDRYAFAATTFGRRGADIPDPDTLEGLLSALPHDRTVIDPGRFTATLDRKLTPRVPADYTYAALDPATIDRADAVVFVKEI